MKRPLDPFFAATVAFDEFGPRLGDFHFLTKSGAVFLPRSASALDFVLKRTFEEPFDLAEVEACLAAIARFMTQGDLVLAAIMSGDVPLPGISSDTASRATDAAALLKASPDDPVHPGWPEGTPDGKGGEFRPKGGAEEAGGAARADKIKRLAARRSLRAMLKRVLTLKRLARLALEVAGEVIPGENVIDTAAMLEDVAEIASELRIAGRDVDAAVAFAEKGPLTLEELTVGAVGGEERFSSFAAFKKEDLDKRFGPAGEGYEYHHIVEQGPNDGSIPAGQLQSTSNIVRIPRLIHEDISAAYNTIEGATGLSVRQSLRGAPFERQRAVGLQSLRQAGVLYP